MAKDKLTEYSATNASNDVIGDISVAEGMLPSAVNNALREQMTHLKNFSDGTDGIDVLSLADDDASAAIKIQAPSAVTTTTTLTLPDGDGDAGAMLQTNGSGQLDWSTAYRNTNLVLNGAMAISQRGVDINALGETGYSADRFRTRTYGGNGRFDYDQVTDVVPSSTFKYAAKYTVSTAATDVGSFGYSVQQVIEGHNIAQLRIGRADAKPFTISFWARSSVSGTYSSGVTTALGDISFVTEFTLVADTWKYISYTVPAYTTSVPSNLNETNGSGLFFTVIGLASQTSKQTSTLDAWQSGNFAFSSNQTNFMSATTRTVHITGVQMEVGEQSTPFEHRSYGEELALCQRYYQTMARGAMGGAYSSTQWIGGGNFNTPMRATPTASQPSGVATVHDPSTATFAQSSTNITATYASTTGSTFILGNLSGMTAYRPMSLFGGQIDFSAEL